MIFILELAYCPSKQNWDSIRQQNACLVENRHCLPQGESGTWFHWNHLVLDGRSVSHLSASGLWKRPHTEAEQLLFAHTFPRRWLCRTACASSFPRIFSRNKTALIICFLVWAIWLQNDIPVIARYFPPSFTFTVGLIMLFSQNTY